MTGVKVNVTPFSFFVLLLRSWVDTKPYMLINNPDQNQQPLLSKQRLLANEKLTEAVEKSRRTEKYATDSPNNLWINQILNTLENHLGKTEGSQKHVSQDKEKDIGELIKAFPESVDLHKGNEKRMALSENSKVNRSVIESILQTLKKYSADPRDEKIPSVHAAHFLQSAFPVAPHSQCHPSETAPNLSDSHQHPTTSSLLKVLKNIVITCLTVTGLLFVLVLLMYIFTSLCMKSRSREAPVNNTYNIYITEEMKNNSACIKELFSKRIREDCSRSRSDSPNLHYVQSRGDCLRDPENKGKLYFQNSNYNNRTIFPGNFMKGRIIPLKGLIVPRYGNKSRPYKDVSSSELSDSDTIQTLPRPKANGHQSHDIPGPHLNKEYMEKKDPNKVSGSHKEPDTLSHSSHKLISPEWKRPGTASPDSLIYTEETQSDTYPSSNTSENSELVGSQGNRSTLLRNTNSPSCPSHSD
ncbi:uncharacterized protein [Notamacropus eugenii]|uniref:uncharacterized protein n=1 Tax=Notamacropus eugenii TaxID=9315 RepID=UPI003B67E457